MPTLRQRIGVKFDSAELVILAVSGYLPVHAARTAILRAFGADLDRDALVYHGYQVRRARRLKIGARTSVGDGTILDARGGLTIGADVNISTGVAIWTAQHDVDSETFQYVDAPVVIGDRAWVSTRAIILPGVTIGEGAVVAAGSVVTKDVEPYTLVGGIPAKKIRDRKQPLGYHLARPSQKSWWW